MKEQQCNTCRGAIEVFYEPYYSEGVLIGERVKHWCAKCSHEVRTEKVTIIKETR
jgi:hypothetical protein